MLESQAVIPVLLDGAQIPAAEHLPESCRALLQRQFVTLSNDNQEIYRLTLERLPQIVGDILVELGRSGLRKATTLIRFIAGARVKKEEGRIDILVDGEKVKTFQLTPGHVEEIALPIGPHRIQLGRNSWRESRISGPHSYYERTQLFEIYCKPAMYRCEVYVSRHWLSPLSSGTLHLEEPLIER